MAKTTNYNNATVVVKDQNDSFVPNKNVRSITVRWTPEQNYFELITPAPQVKREPTPAVFEQKEFNISLNKLAKGYKLSWDVNIQATKIAGKKKVKSAICDAVDAMFDEIEKNNM